MATGLCPSFVSSTTMYWASEDENVCTNYGNGAVLSVGQYICNCRKGPSHGVTGKEGQTVLLTPRIPRLAVPESLTLADKFPVRLLGVQRTARHYERQ